MDTLNRAHLTATLRREKGHDIAAACGQLRRQVAQGIGSTQKPVASEQ
jgi:adenine C2-methylase RlmN of 23S rRNA A2503 and tRNA A37